ncbi:MAG: pantoate--beta-alanine ligase [Glaciecola sp.]
MQRVTTIADLRHAVAGARSAGARIGFVPTMGALHRGHLCLVEQMREHSDFVVVSIFVNPTQFAPTEDLAAYPRDIDADQAALASLGPHAPDLVFAPSVAEVYPTPGFTTVHVEGLGDRLCGASRPTHFDGVTTVVAKLLHMVKPDVAMFGRKDFQQLTVIRRMVADLNLDVDIQGGLTVREPDGVAMSSRNAYLSDQERLAARALSQALRAAVLAARGDLGPGAGAKTNFLRAAAARRLADESLITLDYLEVLHPENLEPVGGPEPFDPATSSGGEAGNPRETAGGKHGQPTRMLVAIAAHVGPARLIDNVVIGDQQDEDALLAATQDGNETAPRR